MNKATHRIIWNYTKMNPFLGYAELRQEAEVARLEAAGTWQEGSLANLDTYTNRAIVLRLYIFTMRQRSPVSAGASRLARKLAGVVRVCFHTGSESNVRGGERREPALNRQSLADCTLGEGSIERRLDMARASAAIRRLIDEQPDGWLAKDVLLGERKPREVADELGIKPRVVRRAVRLVKQALAEAPELRAYAEG